MPALADRYVLHDCIDSSDATEVYKALDLQNDRVVAIKLWRTKYMTHAQPEDLTRFRELAAQALSWSHPNLVPIIDFGDLAARPYIVMRYIQGHNLALVMRSQGVLSLLAKLDIITQVCSGLTFLHQRSIIHGNIQPYSVILEKAGGVKLAGYFPKAYHRDMDVRPDLDSDTALIAVAHLPPEMIRCEPADVRSDVFSTACLLYRLVSGVAPFGAKDMMAVLLNIVGEAPLPLGGDFTGLPADLKKVLLRAISRDREQRHANIEEFACDLQRIRRQLPAEAAPAG